MKVKILGARGSLPAPMSPSQVEARSASILNQFIEQGSVSLDKIPEFLKTLKPHQFGGYGGNTPCVEINAGQTQVIIDGGSGIRTLGYELLSGPCGKGEGEVHIFFTHFHWDHLIGLCFFVPLFIPGNKIHVYSVQPELPHVFKTLFKKPFFPVELEHLGAKIIYHQLDPRKPFTHKDLVLTPYQLDHPDPCWGYKVRAGEKVYAHCVDTEATRMTRDELGADLPLYQGIDLMVFDAQYTVMETIEKINWGHSAGLVGLDIAMREGIKQVIFMHHDPASNDDKVFAAETEVQKYHQSQIKSSIRMGQVVNTVDWKFAVEGMEIQL
ncbi:MAG: MBL fold metallo-hydrolase [Xanthomonadaceae bacterium]|nr:MBL fold metallo-hydrolase [Xanthomonadaceae bacterium]